MWQRTGSVSLESLIPARLELHWAIQPLAAVGNSLVVALSDSSHIALSWSGQEGGFVGASLPGGAAFGLRVAAMELFATGPSRSELALAERTLDEATQWVRQQLRAGGHDGVELVPADYGEALPGSPVADGIPFSVSEAHAEHGRWFGNAAEILQRLAQSEPAAGRVLCWPHHFDIATLLSFDPDADPERARSIGVGLSPGDDACNEPYFYHGPWPRPSASDLPALDGEGEWTTDGWVGARLPASRIVSKVEGPAQAEQVQAFLASGLAACKRLLGVR